MSKIIIKTGSSYVAQNATIALLKGGFVPHIAHISYNVEVGMCDPALVDFYPLIMEGILDNSRVSIHVYSVTAGYNGTGPNTMVAILKAAGFNFEELDILTKRCANSAGQITLTYKL